MKIIKLLTFRLSRNEFLELDNKALIIGLIGTWIVGMGRYWDDPGAHILQHLGLGSVIYIFLLALLIWLTIKAYFVKPWPYKTVLIFISLTSFPAILYAIPVERFFDIELAASLNAWFLMIVAAWRLALLYYFLRVFTQLGHAYIVIGTLAPVCLIIVVLTALNLERAVFDIMGGFHETTANDQAYATLVMLTVISMALAIPILIGYLVLIRKRWKEQNINR